MVKRRTYALAASQRVWVDSLLWHIEAYEKLKYDSSRLIYYDQQIAPQIQNLHLKRKNAVRYQKHVNKKRQEVYDLYLAIMDVMLESAYDRNNLDELAAHLQKLAALKSY